MVNSSGPTPTNRWVAKSTSEQQREKFV